MDYESFVALKDFGEHEDPISHVVFAPSGKYFLSTSEEHLVIWNSLELQPVEEFLFSSAVQAVQFTPEEKSLLVATEEKGLEFWNIEHKYPYYQFPEKDLDILSLTLSHDGKRLAILLPQRLIIFDLTTMRKERDQIFRGNDLTSFAWTAKDDAFLVADEEGILTLYELDSLRKIWQVSEAGNPVYQVDFHPNNEYLVSHQSTHGIMRFRGNGHLVEEFSPHEGNISHVFLEPFGLFVVTASGGEEGDHRIIFHEIASRIILRTFECDDLTDVSLSPKGSPLIAGKKDGTMTAFGIAK